MKKHIFMLALLIASSLKAEPQNPECGSAKHCYTLLKRIQYFSPEERENFKKEAKEIVLNYAQDTLNTLFKTMNDLLEEAKHDKTHTSDLKSKIDALSERTKDTLEKLFYCQSSTHWIEQIEDSKKMEFDVDEFECDQVIEKALKNNNESIVYEDEVNEWLEHFDPTLPEANYKKIAGLESLISVLQMHIKQHDKQNKSYKEYCQEISNGNRVILEHINDMSNEGIQHPYLLLTEATLLSASQKIAFLEALIDKSSNIILEIRNELEVLPASPAQQFFIISHIILHKLRDLRSSLKDTNEELKSLEQLLKVHSKLSSFIMSSRDIL